MASKNSTGSLAPQGIALDETVQGLSRECTFPVPAGSVSVLQTHISVVFLAGDLVYKLKKPVKLPFLDFSTVDLRHHFCNEEVRINRPWAPDVYLGVVPVTRDTDGLRFEGCGPVVDWAVKMRRLPESETLRSRWQRGLLELSEVEPVARRIAEVHRQAGAVFGAKACEANGAFHRYWAENWEFACGLSKDIIEPQVLQRLLTLSNEWKQRLDETLKQRAMDGYIREVHGDLRLEHIFLFPMRAPPGDIVIIDGIEFSPSLRCIDVAADVAFLLMELSFIGRRDLARRVADIYVAAANDDPGSAVLTLFSVYRSAVRGKVASILSAESEVPPLDREKAVSRSRAHWLWCLSELEVPDRRPALVLVSGLPGTGKSTLSRMLADTAHFEVIRSDVVRKEIFATSCAISDPAALYSVDNTQRVYDECLARARTRLLSGGRIIVDATFQREENRRQYLQLAIDCGVQALWLECRVSAEIAMKRLEARRGDASDADWSVYQHVRTQWDSGSELTERFHAIVKAGDSADSVVKSACETLRVEELLS